MSHRRFSNSIYLSWGSKSQVFCNQSEWKCRDTAIVAPLILFSCCSGAQTELSCSRCSVWVFEAVNKLDLQSARWDNICSAVSSEPAPMHICVCLFSSRRLTSRLSQWKLSIWQLFLNSLFSFGIILKNCCSCSIYRITSLLRVFSRLFEELKSASAAFLIRVYILHRWLDF